MRRDPADLKKKSGQVFFALIRGDFFTLERTCMFRCVFCRGISQIRFLAIFTQP